MKIKSYFANSVEAAIGLARQEFGPEAMLMNSRKSVPESRHLGEYEVVFACPNAADESASAATSNSDRSSTPVSSDSLQKEVADLRR